MPAHAPPDQSSSRQRQFPDRRSRREAARCPKTGRAGFDNLGTLLLALTLAAYALAMTTGRGHFGPLNAALVMAALIGGGLFVWAEAKVASPLIRLAAFRNPVFASGLATNALVATVMMATL